MKDKGLTAVFALTVDQRRSRRSTDRVPSALERLAEAAPGAVLGAERTAGDEVQVLLDDPAEVVACLEALTRLGGWWIGIGCGGVEHPLPSSTREARGPAYLAARRAVERAHHCPTGTALVLDQDAVRHPAPGSARTVGAGPYGGAMTTPAACPEPAQLARQAESALWLWQDLLARRSPQGWEVVDLLDAGQGVSQAAARLGISVSAATQRHQRAGHEQAVRGRELCTSLLQRLQDAVADAPAQAC